MTNKIQQYQLDVKIVVEPSGKSTTQYTPEHWIRLLSGSPQINFTNGKVKPTTKQIEMMEVKQ